MFKHLTQTACPLGYLWRHWSPQAWEFQSPSLWGHQHWSVCLLPRWRVSGNHLQLLWPVKTTHLSHLTIYTDYSLLLLTNKYCKNYKFTPIFLIRSLYQVCHILAMLMIEIVQTFPFPKMFICKFWNHVVLTTNFDPLTLTSLLNVMRATLRLGCCLIISSSWWSTAAWTACSRDT